jgi:hypothetical protein
MNKKRLYLFSRFSCILVTYLIVLAVINFEGLALLHQSVFIPLLSVYLIFTIICFMTDEKKSEIIKLIIDIVFCSLFFLETIVIVFLMFHAPGEAGFGYIIIFQYLPIFIFFLFWLRKDILVYEKASYIVRFFISGLFTIIFSIQSIALVYTTVKFFESVYLVNFVYVLPLFILSLFWLVQDIIRCHKRKTNF